MPLVATGKYERDVCLIESYPFLVKIIKKETTQEVFHCSAAILSERWVITPASCCYLSYLPNLYYIVAGSNIGNDLRGRQFLPIKQMKVHPLYTRGQPKNDVCLIYTEVEFKLSKSVMKPSQKKKKKNVFSSLFQIRQLHVSVDFWQLQGRNSVELFHVRQHGDSKQGVTVSAR